MSTPTRTRAHKARILVVTVELQVEKLLKSILTTSGYRVSFASGAAATIPTQTALCPELVILDLDPSDVCGHNAIPEIRRCSEVPMIVLSGQHREADLIAALDLGADDYVEKPFRANELLARVRSVLRRSLKARGETAVYHRGTLEIDVLEGSVMRGGKPIRLTPTEFEILALLVRNSGRIVPYQRFLESPSDARHCRNKRALRTSIWSLRQKIGDTPDDPGMILSADGIGYRLANDPVCTVAG